MKRLALAACAASTGCAWANAKSDWAYGYELRTVLGDDARVAGGAAHAMGGMAGLYASAEIGLHDAQRRDDPDRYQAVGVGLALRGSLFGILGTEHRLERYFDIGAETGFEHALAFGLPDGKTASVLAVWFGAWTELGTLSVASGYLAVTGGIRRAVAQHPWEDQTQLMIGLAWRKRGPADRPGGPRIGSAAHGRL